MVVFIKGSRFSAFNKAVHHAIVIIIPVSILADGVVVLAVDVPTNLFDIPFHSVLVKAIGRVGVFVGLIDELVLRSRHAVVKSRLSNRSVAPKGLHDVDLTLARPTAIDGGVSTQHPECGPEANP